MKKRFFMVVVLFSSLMLLTSCDDPFTKCRKAMVKDGYSMAKALYECKQAYGKN